MVCETLLRSVDSSANIIYRYPPVRSTLLKFYTTWVGIDVLNQLEITAPIEGLIKLLKVIAYTQLIGYLGDYDIGNPVWGMCQVHSQKLDHPDLTLVVQFWANNDLQFQS